MRDPLDEALGVDPLPVVRTEPTVPVPVGADEDYEFARRNLFRLQAKGEDALDRLEEVAISSQHPRAYEVYSTLLGNLVALNKEIMGVKKVHRELETDSGPRVQNNTLVLTSEEMLLQFKRKMNEGL